MQLPVKAHYATLAMLAMAEQHGSGDPLPAREIARRHAIPTQFLGQILQQLRAAGLVSSTRGSAGGFNLVLPPDRIHIDQIVDAVCPNAVQTPGAGEDSGPAGVVLEVWQKLAHVQRQMLHQLTLADLVGRLEAQQDMMFYI